MSETQAILALSRRTAARGEQLCLATVVHVEGSAYRKPGARMLLTSGGERAGTISGGCLESEVSRKAWWLTAQGSRIERYSSFADEDGGMPYGLGCGGTVTLLLEQGEPAQAALAALERALSRREPSVVIVSLGDSLQSTDEHRVSARTAELPGTVAVLRMPLSSERLPAAGVLGTEAGLFESAHESTCEATYLRGNSTGSAALHPDLVRAAQTAFEEQRSCLLTASFAPCNGQQSGQSDVSDMNPSAGAPAYFLEYLGVPPALTIFGAGDDVQPIAELAHALGWRVSVADGRAHLARRERFPHAAEVRVLDYADPSLRAACGVFHQRRESQLAEGQSREAQMRGRQAARQEPSGAATVLLEAEDGTLLCDEIAVVITHSYQQDRALLAALLPRELRYLGLLGPRHRTERLLGEVAPQLGLSIEEAFARLHSPIGLDLGATDPATVALSIIAEIQATLQGRALLVRRAGAHDSTQHADI